MSTRSNKRGNTSEETDESTMHPKVPHLDSTEECDVNTGATGIQDTNQPMTSYEQWKRGIIGASSETNRMPQMLPDGASAERGPVSIKSLNLKTAFADRWIQGKVVKARPEMAYENKNGRGKLRQYVISDSTGDIQFTIFNDVLDKWNELLKVGVCVNVKEFGIQESSKQYGLTANDLELKVWNSTRFEVCNDIENCYFFTSATELSQCRPGSCIDMLGLIIQILPVREFHSGKYQEIMLADKTGKFTLKLWNDLVDSVELTLFNTLILKLGKVAVYKEFMSIEMNPGDMVLGNSEQEDCVELRRWFEAQDEATLQKY